MDKYHDTIKKRMRYSVLALLLLLLLEIITVFIYAKSGETKYDFIYGYQSGIIAGLLAMTVVYLIRYSRILKKPELLNKLYITEHDERNKAINEKSGSVGINIVMFGMMAASNVAGYFNMMVSATLVATTLFVAVVRIALKFYYRRKL